MNQRIIHNLVQGTPEWAAFRLEHDGASEAAAAMGLSKKVTRSELLRIKHTGIAKEFSDWVQKNVLDYGHEVEEAARPLIVELIGEPLFPVTMSYGRLSASCDGITMGGETAFEHKQWAAELAAAVRRKELPEEHQPQCQQIMHVTGAERVIFTVSDGTPENLVWMEVLPDPEWVKRIEAAWAQFHEDLKTYTPPEVIPAAVAAPIKDLPAVVLTVSGSLAIETNFAVWGVELRDFIARIPTNPATDQEFADCKAALAAFKKAEAQLDAEEARVLSMVPDIDSMKREKKLLSDLSKTTRLALEKLVERRDIEVKAEIIQAGKDALAAHMANLNKRLGTVQMPPVAADFAGAIKSKRNLENMRGAVSDLVAAKKIETTEIADKIDANLKTLNAAGHEHLFKDYATLAMKAPDDLALVIKTRIDDEEKRQREENERILEAERVKIRVEEEEKAAAKVKAEQEAAALAAKQNTSAEPTASVPAANEGTGETPALGQRETPLGTKTVIAIDGPFTSDVQIPQSDTGATVKLGQIGERLGFTVTADFLGLLGFHAEQKQNARLYRECDFPRICAAIARHCDAVGSTSMQRSA